MRYLSLDKENRSVGFSNSKCGKIKCPRVLLHLFTNEINGLKSFKRTLVILRLDFNSSVELICSSYC